MLEDDVDDIEGRYVEVSDQNEDEISVLSNGSGLDEIVLVDSAAYSRSTGRMVHNRVNQVSSSANVRKGKWTVEEENYTQKIISLFNRGKLPIPAGTTLRSYLSEQLNCDPMRITKKFAGATAIGKVVYQPADLFGDSIRGEDISLEMEELKRLEVIFLEKLHGRDEYLKQSSRSTSRDSNREFSLPAAAKVAEVVEKVRTHDRGLRSSGIGGERVTRNQTATSTSTIIKQEDYSNALSSPTGSMAAGMKRNVSAPNFSQLSSLQSSWKHRDDQSKQHALATAFDSAAARSLHTRSLMRSQQASANHPVEEQQVGSHHNDRRTSGLSVEFSTTATNFSTNAQNGLLRSKKRSQSAMDLQEYEHLTSFMMNDTAAGDLLLQFSKNLNSTYVPRGHVMPRIVEDDIAISHIPNDDEHINNNSNAEDIIPFNPSTPEGVDVGLSLDEESHSHAHTQHTGTSTWQLPPLSHIHTISPSITPAELLLVNRTTNLTITDDVTMPQIKRPRSSNQITTITAEGVDMLASNALSLASSQLTDS